MRTARRLFRGENIAIRMNAGRRKQIWHHEKLLYNP